MVPLLGFSSSGSSLTNALMIIYCCLYRGRPNNICASELIYSFLWGMLPSSWCLNCTFTSCWHLSSARCEKITESLLSEVLLPVVPVRENCCLPSLRYNTTRTSHLVVPRKKGCVDPFGEVSEEQQTHVSQNPLGCHSVSHIEFVNFDRYLFSFAFILSCLFPFFFRSSGFAFLLRAF